MTKHGINVAEAMVKVFRLLREISSCNPHASLDLLEQKLVPEVFSSREELESAIRGLERFRLIELIRYGDTVLVKLREDIPDVAP